MFKQCRDREPFFLVISKTSLHRINGRGHDLDGHTCRIDSFAMYTGCTSGNGNVGVADPVGWVGDHVHLG